MKKFLIFILIAVGAVVTLTVVVPYVPDSVGMIFNREETTEELSDEEKIHATIDSFNEAYRKGDLDAVIDCTTGRLHSILNLQVNILGKLASKLLGGFLDIDSGTFADIFSLGTDFYNCRFEVKNIEFISDKEAKVSVSFIQTGKIDGEVNSGSVDTVLYMEKDGKKWLISGEDSGIF